ncbi:MAG: efflux RND transporter periplasmic adaptor subunit [Halothiobacillus sp.]|nr:efflux RND transporter periplasmic adaptor subunit [Halothiobacillus sp.]
MSATKPQPSAGAESARAPIFMQKSGGSRWKRWLLIVLAVVVLVAGYRLFRGQETNTPQYVTQPVQRGDLTVEVTATGTLAPTNQVDVGIEVSGTIKEVLVDYNDKVKVGQPLALLDPTKLEAQLRQSTAALDAARARVQQAEATVQESKSQLARLEDVRKMSGGKVPSKLEFDKAQAAYNRAKADLASARASVVQSEAVQNANRTDLSKTVVRSPINGIVLNRNVEPGQTIAASFQAPVLFTLAEDLTQMELQVDVDEADVGQVHVGQPARFTVDAYPDRNFDAKVTQVRYGSQTVSGVVTYKTILKVDNRDLLLRPGMTATAHILVNEDKNALLVPNAALRFSPPVMPTTKSSGGLISNLMPRPPRSTQNSMQAPTGKEQRVWILKDGKPEPIDVLTGQTNGIMTAITEGALQPGTPLIVDMNEQTK